MTDKKAEPDVYEWAGDLLSWEPKFTEALTTIQAVFADRWRKMYPPEEPKTKTCPRCEGKKVVTLSPCHYCNGTGEVEG